MRWGWVVGNRVTVLSRCQFAIIGVSTKTGHPAEASRAWISYSPDVFIYCLNSERTALLVSTARCTGTQPRLIVRKITYLLDLEVLIFNF